MPERTPLHDITAAQGAVFAEDAGWLVPAHFGGLPDVQVEAWNALFAPKGTPPQILSRLRLETGRALATPGMKERLEKSGLELWAVPGEELTAVMREDNARWIRVVREANIKAD